MKNLNGRLSVIVIVLLVLAAVAYASYRIGHLRATREGLRHLAFVSLFVAKPSVQLIDYAAANPTPIPSNIQGAAIGSVYMVAGQSMIFDPNLTDMDVDAQRVLCAIAKNRELHRRQNPDLYSEALMVHLAKVHSVLAPHLAQINARLGKEACSV